MHQDAVGGTLKQSSIIILNSLIGLLRIVVAIAIGFVATRLLLNQLGFVDFGVLTALGATGIISTTLIAGLTNASKRHLAYEVGLGEGKGLAEVFSSSLSVFLVLGFILLGAGMLLTPVIFSVLNVPVDRIESARIVYYSMVVTWSISTMASPAYALMHAHQHMIAHSVFEILTKISDLIIVISLSYLEGDTLVMFALLSLLVRVVTLTLLAVYVFAKYPLARPGLASVSRDSARKVVSFAGWSLLSSAVFQLRQQGAIFVVNIFYGPVANAAYALANSINGYVHQASQAVQNAVQPAMTSVYAKNDSVYFGLLISTGSRYTWFAALFLFIPIFLEAEFFLKLWLGQYPDGTPEFVRLVTVASVLAYAFNGYGLAMVSQDRMSELVPVTSGLQVFAFILGVLAIYLFDYEARALPIAIIAGMLLLWIVVPLAFGKSLNFSMGRWLSEVVVPCLLVTLVGFSGGVLAQLLLDEGLLRLCLVTASVGMSLLVAVVAIGITAEERGVFQRLIMNAMKSRETG